MILFTKPKCLVAFSLRKDQYKTFFKFNTTQGIVHCFVLAFENRKGKERFTLSFLGIKRKKHFVREDVRSFTQWKTGMRDPSSEGTGLQKVGSTVLTGRHRSTKQGAEKDHSPSSHNTQNNTVSFFLVPCVRYRAACIRSNATQILLIRRKGKACKSGKSKMK